MATSNSKPQKKQASIEVDSIDPSDTDFFGSPPLTALDDPSAYVALLARVQGIICPKDVIEEIYMRDVVDLVWESLRLRRLKVALLDARAHSGVKAVLTPLIGSALAHELAFRASRSDPEARRKVVEHLASAGLSLEAASAETLCQNLDAIERIDRMISSAEARRANMLREIERHRGTLAAALRRATEEPEDAEFREVNLPAVISAER
jgi:hypothetical protein